MRLPILLSVCVATSGLAAKPKAKPAPPPPVVAPAAPAPVEVAPPAPVVETRTATDLLKEAQSLYDALEYDKVAPLAARALAVADITLEQKLAAYQLQGSALAIIGDPVDAERPFLLLLSVRPDFTVPADTPPKIKSVFAKVKGEFDAVREAQEAQQRKELAATIDIGGALPATADGGKSLRFEFTVADPRGVVKSVRVQYRRQGESEFLGLPLRKSATGAWVGVVPGEWTASDAGFTMEAAVVVADQKGLLKQLGDPPITVTVSAGALERQRPVPLWAFGTSVGVTGVTALAASGITAATAWQNADFHAKLDAASPESPASGADIVAQQRLGENLNVAALAGWGTAGVAAIVTGVLALFTNWSGEELDVVDPAPAAPSNLAATTAAAR